MLTFDFNGSEHKIRFWSNNDGCIGDLVAFDTETDTANGFSIPPFVLGQAYARENVVNLITLNSLADFFRAHHDKIFVMHNAPFDMAVVEREIGFDFDRMIRGERLFDTGIMHQLYELATKGKMPKWSLAHLASLYLGLELEKEAEVRCTFGEFRKDNIIHYDKIPEEHLIYAAKDAVATYEVFSILNKRIKRLNCKNYLSHKIQLMGAVALHKISINGIGFDLVKKLQFQKTVQEKSDKNKGQLAKFGFYPGKKGVNKDYENIIKRQKLELPLTPTGAISRKAKHLEKYRPISSFVDAYLEYISNNKMLSFLNNLNNTRIHTHFTPILKTGRTSSFEPNLQNIPQNSSLRECFIPASNNVFIIIDYKQIEMCTLAQTCYEQYGFSKMRDLLNDGVDLHYWFGSVITGKPKNEVTIEERKRAKACNFGFPGGLGIDRFLDFIKAKYNIVDVTEEMARALKEQWLSTFPEMRLYLRDSLLDRYDFSSFFDNANRNRDSIDPNMACNLFKRIVGGKVQSRKGTPYTQHAIDWALKEVLPDLAPQYAGALIGNAEILEEISRETIEIRTGRIRAHCKYTAARNTPFQGLAADGAKIALYRLIKNNYKVVNFIHDEFIIELPIECDQQKEGENIKTIVVEGMKAVVPDVNIDAEWKVCNCWMKN